MTLSSNPYSSPTTSSLHFGGRKVNAAWHTEDGEEISSVMKARVTSETDDIALFQMGPSELKAVRRKSRRNFVLPLGIQSNWESQENGSYLCSWESATHGIITQRVIVLPTLQDRLQNIIDRIRQMFQRGST
jgi:hypothetical protein